MWHRFLFQYLMASFVSASDAFMLGFLDQDSLAASSPATQIPFVYSLFYGAFVFGFNVLAAQYWGKGDKKSVEEILTIAMRYALLVGILFSRPDSLYSRADHAYFHGRSGSDRKRCGISADSILIFCADRLYTDLLRSVKGMRSCRAKLHDRLFGSCTEHCIKCGIYLRTCRYACNGDRRCSTCHRMCEDL